MVAQGASSLAGVANSVTQASALRQQGAYARSAQNQNALNVLAEARDAKLRGERANALHLRRAGLLQGAQRAKYAGQGVDVNAGSPAEIQADTAAMAAEDSETLLNNAYREGHGLRAQAAGHRQAGRMAHLSARNEANATLLTGGLGFSRDALYGSYLYEQMRKRGGDSTRGFGTDEEAGERY